MSKLYLICAEIDQTTQWKIGATRREPSDRVMEMRTANPNIIGVVAEYETTDALLYKIESVLKRYYKRHKVAGEWLTEEATNRKQFLSDCERIERNFKTLSDHTNIL